MASSRLERIGTIYSRKQLDEKIIKNFTGIFNQLEKDKVVIKENNEKLSYILEQAVKASQQSSSTIKLRITGLHEILNSYNKQCKTMEDNQARQFEEVVNSELNIVEDKLQNLSRCDKLDQFIQNLL